MNRESRTEDIAVAAYVRVLTEITPQLRSFAARRGVPYDTIDDLIQIAGTKVYERLGSAKIRSLEAYFRTTFSNCVVDYYRQRRPEVTGWGSGDSEGQISLEEIANRYDYETDNEAIRQDRAACVERVLQEIERKEPLRGVALELAFEGIAGRNMAEALGKTAASANEFLSQTRKLFEALVQEKCEEGIN